MFRSFYDIYICLYIYIYFYIYLEKERNVLFCSLQKNGAFFALFSVLCKRTERSLCSFPLFRKERKRTEHSLGSHKSLKTREKNGKERNILLGLICR